MEKLAFVILLMAGLVWSVRNDFSTFTPEQIPQVNDIQETLNNVYQPNMIPIRTVYFNNKDDASFIFYDTKNQYAVQTGLKDTENPYSQKTMRDVNTKLTMTPFIPDFKKIAEKYDVSNSF
jgi:hypothetical protein